MAIVFVGNSGAARECYWVLRQAQAADKSIPPFKGFIAWQGYAGNLCELASLSLGSSDSYLPAADDLFVIAIGKPALRKQVYEWLKSINANFYTLRFPDVYLCPSASIGEANIFTRGCVVLANAQVGNGNFFNGGIIVGHDCKIGNFNTFNLCASLSGNVCVGNQNLFSPMTLVLQHAKIGSHNTTAPYSVIYRGCGDYCHMAGNPALIERRLNDIHE